MTKQEIKLTFIIILLAIAFAACTAPYVLAQSPQPKAADNPVTVEKKEPPAEVVLTAEAVKELTAKVKDAELARLAAENLTLKIQQAQEQLKKLTEDAQRAASESQAAYQRAAIKAGIPGDQIEQYQGEAQPNGTLVLRRRPPQTPAPPKQ